MIASYGNCEFNFMFCECLNTCIFFVPGLLGSFRNYVTDFGGKFGIYAYLRYGQKHNMGVDRPRKNILKNIHVSKHNRLQLVMAFLFR
jgi:hypothetical protein